MVTQVDTYTVASRNTTPAPNIGLSAIYSCRYLTFSNSQQVWQYPNVLTASRAMHMTLFNSGYTYFGGWCGQHDRQEIYNHSCIVIRHVVIGLILCITFKYTCFHIAVCRFYLFYRGKDLYLGPVQSVWLVQCFVTPLKLISKSYVSPIACRCCPISLTMSLSVRDISFTAGQGSDEAGSSLPFRCASAPFICEMSSAIDSSSNELRLPAWSADDTGGGGCCMAEQRRSFFVGGGVMTADDGVPSTSLSDEEARLAMRPSTDRATGPQRRR